MLFAEYRLRKWDDTEVDEANRPVLYYLWQWFCELSTTRDHAIPPAKFSSLKYREIAAWATLKDLIIHPFEVDILRRMDELYRSIVEGHGVKELGGMSGGKNEDAIASLVERAVKLDANG